ncbi:MAG: hypothetical protein P9M14_02040 [Candidatus Alcyoniella australis]|nr:hypothetical protein [Candidatus Alcyoniella australis]
MTPKAKIRRAAQALDKLYGPLSKRPQGQMLGALVETILSQNTTDLNSQRAYSQLRGRFRTWEAARRAGPTAIEDQIRVGGLAGTKARRIHALLQQLHKTYGRCDLEFLRELPTELLLEELLRIPGVGPKTALVVASFEDGRPVFPMDTHVHRVLTRLGVISGDRARIETHREVERWIEPQRLHSLHLQLIELGREQCRPRPRCASCPLAKICDYAQEQKL